MTPIDGTFPTSELPHRPPPRFFRVVGRGLLWGLVAVAVQIVWVALAGEAAREDLCFGGAFGSGTLAFALLLTGAMTWRAGSARWLRDAPTAWGRLLRGGTYTSRWAINSAVDGYLAPLIVRCGAFCVPLLASSIVLGMAFNVGG